ADSQVTQHVAPRPAHLNLKIRDGELFAYNRTRMSQLTRDPAHGSVQSQSGLDAHDHEIERVRKPEKDRLVAALLPLAYGDVGKIHPQPPRKPGKDHGRLAHPRPKK